MKLSKYFILGGLLLGAAAPFTIALHQKQSVVQADTTKDLSTIMSTGNRSFSTSYIDNFFFDFSLSEQIFSRTGYMNDHIDEFLDENNQPINLGEGIVINGQTLNYWRNFEPTTLSYPRNDGVVAFPLYAGKKFNPVAIEVTADKLAFKVNLEYFPMDSIVVTFKAGIFKGYNNGVKYTLSQDLTFYSTLNETPTSSNSNKITFVRQRNEVVINAKITQISDWGEQTASQGGKYRRYVFYTNVPRNFDYAPDTFPATHYRYIYDNVLVNNKSLTYHNAWVRGNQKDFSNLSDASTQLPEYETGHPAGSPNVNEDLPLYLQFPSDQENYVSFLNVPNQLLTDFSYQGTEIGLRDGSAWYTKDENGNSIIGRIDRNAFNDMVSSAYNELTSYVNLEDYGENEQEEINSIIASAQTQMQDAFTQVGINSIVAEAKLAIDNVEDPEQRLEREHIEAVVALIDALPSEITYTEQVGAAINAAMEAYASLTASEVSQFPSEKLDALYNAYNTFSALDLANYKALSKAEIQAKVNLNDYRELQQSSIQDLLNLTFGLIDAATSKATVQQIVDTFYVAFATIPTDAELSVQELRTAKDEAKAQLDAIDLSVYSGDQLAQVQELITNGKVAIEQCKSIDEVETLLNKILTVIASIKTDADISNEQAAIANKQAQQRAGIITIVVVSSLTLVTAMGLAIFFIKRRKVNQ